MALRGVSAPGVGIVGLAVDQDGPEDSGVFVGDSKHKAALEE